MSNKKDVWKAITHEFQIYVFPHRYLSHCLGDYMALVFCPFSEMGAGYQVYRPVNCCSAAFEKKALETNTEHALI